MNRSKVRKIIDSNVRQMRVSLGIQDWQVDFLYKTGSHKACCLLEPEYRRVIITIDWKQQQNKTDVLRSLRHELLHVLHADFELCRQMVHDEKVSVAFNFACEKLVGNLERMLDLQLGLSPKKLMSLSKEHEHESL